MGAGPATYRERWARLRRSLWQPPRPHGEQPRERVVGPLELFYDLAVVVLVAEAARPAPLLLGLGLVLLLAIPWGLAVAYRLANPADSPVE